jgi:hypothetical protein
MTETNFSEFEEEFSLNNMTIGNSQREWSFRKIVFYNTDVAVQCSLNNMPLLVSYWYWLGEEQSYHRRKEILNNNIRFMVKVF